MDKSRLVTIGKYLSKHLRHRPERLGLQLARGGWVEVEALLAACAQQGFPVSRTELDEVVTRNNKQRFAFDGTGTLIRANQGHSVAVELELEPVSPPAVLYHGTAQRHVAVITVQGLCKMARHHVHLSQDIQTARAVGSRHGKPVVFAVDAAAMQQAGFVFYCTVNGVWLVDSVPPIYLETVG